MSSSPTGWLPLILTTFGAGVAGSVIATYGGQARERRKARSQVMDCLQRLETARVTRPVVEGFDYNDKDMAELSARAVLAGVPQYLVSLYQHANEAPRYLKPNDNPDQFLPENRLKHARFNLGFTLPNDAAALLARAVWHPWLSLLFRRSRARKLRELINRVFPPDFKDGKEMTVFTLSEWETAQTDWRNWQAAKQAIEAARREQGDGEEKNEDEPQDGRPSGGEQPG